VDFVLENLADLAAFGIDQLRQGDHRIGARVDRRLAALVEFLAHRYVSEFAAVDQFISPFARRFAGQDFLHEVVVRAKLSGKERERIAEPENFEVFVNWLVGKETVFQRRQTGVAELAEPLAAWLRLLLGSTNQRAGDAEEMTAIKASGVLQQSADAHVL